LEILELLHISQYAQKMPDTLSGGEQQRCAIARAMIAENGLLLADEPTGALDSETGTEVMEILARLNRERNITIIVVTHDRNVADYADRIITIKDGKLLEDLQQQEVS
jgi:ABC-type lipoprotein export system ATPase subunit